MRQIIEENKSTPRVDVALAACNKIIEAISNYIVIMGLEGLDTDKFNKTPEVKSCKYWMKNKKELEQFKSIKIR